MYGLSRLGNYKVDEVLVSNPTAASNDAAKLRFELSNHRNDVTAVVGGTKDANNSPTIYSLTENDPWGFTFQGRNFVSENSRFGYQGSERDAELLDGAFYNTDFRGLDVARGEWTQCDLLIHPWESPYASMANNPITLTDKMGLDPTSCPTWGGGNVKIGTMGMDFTSDAFGQANSGGTVTKAAVLVNPAAVQTQMVSGGSGSSSLNTQELNSLLSNDANVDDAYQPIAKRVFQNLFENLNGDDDFGMDLEASIASSANKFIYNSKVGRNLGRANLFGDKGGRRMKNPVACPVYSVPSNNSASRSLPW